MEKEINLLAVSDVHIGCPRLDPRLLHQRLEKYLYSQITPDTDILFICGDFFDTLLNLNSLASLESLQIIDELKAKCRANNCDLRVLRGTFTHDRNQPQHFIYGEDPEDKTVRMFDQLALEYHEKTGLNILYIPDNLPTADIYKDIRTLLEAHNLEKVDVMIHHGYFKHLLPEALREKTHGCLDADITSKFVTGVVLNGHVHQTSIYKNVISIGSFERSRHDETGQHGIYKIKVTTDDVWHFSFVENTECNKFFTYDLRCFGTMGSEAVAFFTRKWEEEKKAFRPQEQIRIRFLSEDPAIVEACTKIAIEGWENTLVDKANVVKREQILENINMELGELPTITPDNIEELLLPIVQRKNPEFSLEDVKQVMNVVKGIKEEGTPAQ